MAYLDVSPMIVALRTSPSDFEMKRGAVHATCSARTTAQTGVEMEALAGVAIALLTIYDMCKAIDQEMEISDVRLIKKTKSVI